LKIKSWKKIIFNSTSINSELDNIIVKYSGWCALCVKAGIEVNDSLVTLKNSLIESNKYTGVHLNNSDSLIDNVQFIDNKIGIFTQDGNPTIQSSLFKKNDYGVRVSNGSPILDILSLIFGTGEEANTCNIFQNSQCINPAP